jgi:hypothetical protein
MLVFPAYLVNWAHHVEQQAEGIHQRLEQMRAQHATSCATTTIGLQLNSRITAAQDRVRRAEKSLMVAFDKHTEVTAHCDRILTANQPPHIVIGVSMDMNTTFPDHQNWGQHLSTNVGIIQAKINELLHVHTQSPADNATGPCPTERLRQALVVIKQAKATLLSRFKQFKKNNDRKKRKKILPRTHPGQRNPAPASH